MTITFSLRLPEDTHTKLRVLGIKKGMSQALVEIMNNEENTVLAKTSLKTKTTSLVLTQEQIDKIQEIADKNDISSKAKAIIALVDKAWEIRKRNSETDDELGNIL